MHEHVTVSQVWSLVVLLVLVKERVWTVLIWTGLKQAATTTFDRQSWCGSSIRCSSYDDHFKTDSQIEWESLQILFCCDNLVPNWDKFSHKCFHLNESRAQKVVCSGNVGLIDGNCGCCLLVTTPLHKHLWKIGVIWQRKPKNAFISDDHIMFLHCFAGSSCSSSDMNLVWSVEDGPCSDCSGKSAAVTVAAVDCGLLVSCLFFFLLTSGYLSIIISFTRLRSHSFHLFSLFTTETMWDIQRRISLAWFLFCSARQ